MMTLPTQLRLALPHWLHTTLAAADVYRDDAAKIALAITLSRQNIDAGSGGPFGAAIFDADHRLVAVGVNRVIAHHCSLAHAEIMAYMLAQQRMRTPRLNAGGGPITLATSSQPCCQCYGATIWAGIDRLLIGARSEDVTALAGFDEGPLPANWIGELNRRGIEVTRDLNRDAACAVLRRYAQADGARY